MKRINLEKKKPKNPFREGLRQGIKIAAVPFVPILLWMLGLIGYRLLTSDHAQPSATEMPAPTEQEQP